MHGPALQLARAGRCPGTGGIPLKRPGHQPRPIAAFVAASPVVRNAALFAGARRGAWQA